MTYTNSIPVSGDSLGSTRDRIRVNFEQIAIVEAINHVAFNSAGEGKHKFLQMPEQAAAPAVAVNEAGFYAKVSTPLINPAESNLFFRGESDGTEYQLTKAISTVPAPERFGALSATAPNGWTFLPGGLILQWGEVAAPAGTSGTVTFATSNINFPTGIIQVQLQLYRTEASANESVIVNQSTPPTTSAFLYRSTSSSATAVIKWMAIGY